jgi:hypothetical protein
VEAHRHFQAALFIQTMEEIEPALQSGAGALRGDRSRIRTEFTGLHRADLRAHARG